VQPVINTLVHAAMTVSFVSFSILISESENCDSYFGELKHEQNQKLNHFLGVDLAFPTLRASQLTTLFKRATHALSLLLGVSVATRLAVVTAPVKI
jgi:hypothetical protein|tara:strand:+ start:1099 stop:1386 length:288 start_codon:yes stop_codon:yes gene_type:complete